MDIPEINDSNFYSVILFGAAALLVTGLQPILLGAMIAANFISLSDAGLVAMTEITFIGLGAGFSPVILPLKWARTALVGATVGLAIANALSSTAPDFSAILAYRSAAGLCSGVIIWVVTSTLVRMSLADRRAGVFLAICTFIQAVFAGILALIIVPQYGWQGCFLIMAICSVAPLFLTGLLAPTLKPLPERKEGTRKVVPMYIFLCTLTLLHLSAIGSIWAFIEPLGVSAGISVRTIELTVAFALLAQVFGGFFGAWLSPKLPACKTLFIIAMMQLMIAIYLGYAPVPNALRFLILTVVFGGLWLFLLPFQFRLSLTVDPSGRLTTIIPAFQFLGGAVGPLVVSLIIGANPAIAALAAAGFLLAVLIMLTFLPSPSR